MLSFRRTFSVNPAAFASGHPYCFDSPNKAFEVSFFEFRGTGPPSQNFGYAGDVYVDLTPGLHALYWRDRHGLGPGRWRKWTALLLDKYPLYKYLISHPWANDPQESDLYLWVDPKGVTWASRSDICASRVLMIQKEIATVTPGVAPDVDSLVAEILVKMIQTERHATLPESPKGQDSYSGTRTAHRLESESIRGARSSPGPYSLSEAFSPREHIPSSKGSSSARRNTAPSPVRFGQGSPVQQPIASTSHIPPRSSTQPAPPTSPHPLSVPDFRYSDRRRPTISSAGPPDQHTHTVYRGYSPGISPTPGTQQPPAPMDVHQGGTELDLRESFAWKEVQRAQYAEAHFKRELRLKNRELSRFKKKEKDIISMSFLYQKKEHELMTALAAVEKRSHAELEEQRAALRAAQRQVEEAEEQTRNVARDLRRLEEALADARREVQELKAYAEMMDLENSGLREEVDRLSFSRHERSNSGNRK
ncbi:hypothetical protein B0H10DRAFT_2033007 [Mycena sp. CBHHK59/15]|nr:hypothetical protein B0H10DRAFT_2033007 [Mycena sp. CBHHK59/15]